MAAWLTNKRVRRSDSLAKSRQTVFVLWLEEINDVLSVDGLHSSPPPSPQPAVGGSTCATRSILPVCVRDETKREREREREREVQSLANKESYLFPS